MNRVKIDLVKALEDAGKFHGHLCPGLAVGVRAAVIALEHLKAGKAGFEETVEEELLAIVECNNCMVDGVQAVTGCTLGNNSLIYFDLGKNAVTLVKRSKWKGVRVYVDFNKIREKYFSKGDVELFEKVIVKRSGTDEDRKLLSERWRELSYKILEDSGEVFKVEWVEVKPIEKAPIFESVKCDLCGELAMTTRIINISGRNYCLKCAGKPYHAVIGRGIVEVGVG